MLPSLSRLPADTAREADGEGLTRVLKRTSLVPTGACLPRSFDPDYCAYDAYYAIGVSLVSAVMGALVESPHTFAGYGRLVKTLNEALGRLCHTPKEDGWVVANPQAKQFRYMSGSEKLYARENFGTLCGILNAQLEEQISTANLFHDLSLPPPYKGDVRSNFERLVKKMVMLIMYPGATLMNPFVDLVDASRTNRRLDLTQLKLMKDYAIKEASVEEENAVLRPLLFAGMAATSAWTLKYISRFMNEHAMMVASFFRVNNKRLHSSQPLLLDLKAFARMCKEDIANGPNPPPPLPTAEELAAAEAAASAENRRQNDLVDEVMRMPTIMASYE